MRRSLVRVLVLVFVFALSAAAFAGESIADKLKAAGANKWVQLDDKKGAGRRWPMFVHHPGLKKYLLSAGDGGGYEQQLFAPATCTWSDFLPKGKASLPAKVKIGTTGPGKAVDGIFRIRRAGNAFRPTDPFTYHQWALSGDDGCLYAYFQNTTMKFDAKAGLWKVLGVPAFSGTFKARSHNSNLTMGALAWDPVNKGVLSCGGNDDSDGGSPGTWFFKPGADKWTRVPAGSRELKSLRSQARELERKTHALVNAWRNRFYLTENQEEAKADIGKRANRLAKDFGRLIAEIRKAKLTGFEKNVPGQAAGFFSKVLAELKAAAANSDPRGRLLALQHVRDHVEVAARSLDAEPCGRGLSQMATDPKRGKIVLFGGCRLDSYLADTWVYDCKARKWEQRWPKVSPAPRAGHLLGWLPKSGKIVLFGSTRYDVHYWPPYQNKSLPHDLWVYDIEGNRWKLLPQSGKPPANGTGAVGPGDALIFLPRPVKNFGVQPRFTWGLQVDAGAPDAGSAKAGVGPGAVTYCFHGPDRFDRSAKIEPKKIDTFLKELPPNRWTPMPKQGPDCNNHVWSASAYDAERHQILFYGGGHSAWHYNDVSHYSLRTATWSTGYRDEYPFGPSGFKSPVNQSFNNRPFFASHIWDAFAYDPVADRAVMCSRANGWAYDPAAREWTYPPQHSVGEGVNVAMGETPHGAVQWHAGRLLLYGKETGKWKPLPVTGPKLGRVFAEDSFVCYDSKRSRLWLSSMGAPVYRYDFEGGKLTAFECPRPPHGRRWMRETVYVPELDMLVGLGRAKSAQGTAGNLAFDIAAGKWVVLVLNYSDGKEYLTTGGSGQHVSDGLHYDPLYKVLLLHRNNKQVLVARPEKKGLKILDAPVVTAKKK